MKYLLDTHLLLWWVQDNPELSVPAREIIADPANMVFVSAVAHWEIAIKASMGKLRLPVDFAARLNREAFENLPLTADHARKVQDLPWIHRDPFDRALVAQASLEGLTLITADEVLKGYGDFVRKV